MGTDITSAATGEGLAAFGIGLEPMATNASLIAVDHCSAECIGIHANASAIRHEALEPICQGVRRSFSAFGKNVAKSLKIRHDHGSQYMSRDFQREIAFLGAESSLAFVRVPEGRQRETDAPSGSSEP